MEVKFVDLGRQYSEIAPEIDRTIKEVIGKSAFIKGEFTNSFENNFAAYLGVGNCVGVGNGTDALFIALKSLGIGAGDQVITAANTFIATAEAISLTGATPVFADCRPDTYNIDPEDIESKLTDKTRAVLPVHLYGCPADMDPIRQIAERNKLAVVEDSAQAHGRSTKFGHRFAGTNSRMDGIQAAVLDVKLRHLEGWTERRRQIARLYNENLDDSAIKPVEPEGCRHVYHLYVVRVKNRDGMRKTLAGKGISTGVHYPDPLPFTEAYKHPGLTPDQFPVSHRLKDELLSLPIHGSMTDEEIEYVIDCFNQAAAAAGSRG